MDPNFQFHPCFSPEFHESFLPIFLLPFWNPTITPHWVTLTTFNGYPRPQPQSSTFLQQCNPKDPQATWSSLWQQWPAPTSQPVCCISCFSCHSDWKPDKKQGRGWRIYLTHSARQYGQSWWGCRWQGGWTSLVRGSGSMGHRCLLHSTDQEEHSLGWKDSLPNTPKLSSHGPISTNYLPCPWGPITCHNSVASLGSSVQRHGHVRNIIPTQFWI